jgi:hypothetical protein
LIRNELEMRFSGSALEPLEPLGGRGTDASVAQAPVGPSHLFRARARVGMSISHTGSRPASKDHEEPATTQATASAPEPCEPTGIKSAKETSTFAGPSASTSTMPQHIRSPKLLPQVTAPNGVVNANQGLQWTRGPVALCGVMTQSEVGGSSAPMLKPESLDIVRKSCGVMLKQTHLFPPVVPAEGGCRRGAEGDGRYTPADAGTKTPCVWPIHGVFYPCASSR